MNEGELRANDLKYNFELIIKDHERFIENFKNSYLSKVESLESDEYLNMKSWLKEYSRIMRVSQVHLNEFEEYGHEQEHPDEDDLIKQAVVIQGMLRNFHYPNSVRTYESTQSSNDE